MRLILLIILLICLILEVSLTTIPLLLIVLNTFLVIYKRVEIVAYAFVFGMLIDILSFREIGTTSLFFTIFLFLVLLYQRKFEIKTPSFIVISTFLGSLSYLFIANVKILFLESFFGAIISLLLFLLFRNKLNYG